jgi:hypothetical protein
MVEILKNQKIGRNFKESEKLVEILKNQKNCRNFKKSEKLSKF